MGRCAADTTPGARTRGRRRPAHKPREASPLRAGATRTTATSTRTNLRKLSEWIKMMRELEARKRNGGDQD